MPAGILIECPQPQPHVTKSIKKTKNNKRKGGGKLLEIGFHLSPASIREIKAYCRVARTIVKKKQKKNNKNHLNYLLIEI